MKEKLSDKPVLWWALAGVLALMIVVIAIFTISWIQENRDFEPVSAVVNGESVYRAEVELIYTRLPPELKDVYTPSIILDQTIDKVLVLQHAEELDIRVSEEMIDTRIEEQVASLGTSLEQLEQILSARDEGVDEYRKAVQEELIVNAYVEQEILSKIRIRDSDVQQYYEDNIEDYSAGPDQRRIRHILVETQEQAEQVIADVNDGQSFAALARAVSIGPSNVEGGSLGFIDAQSPLVPEFLEAALALEVEELSEPVQTQFGWHVIYRDSDVIPVSQARQQISTMLRDQRGREAFEARLRELRQEASIRILGDIDSELIV